jgi:hypothetical protein
MQIISRLVSFIDIGLFSTRHNQFQARHFYDDEEDDDEDDGAQYEGEYEYENDDESQYDGADGSDGYGGNPPTHRGAAANAGSRHDFDDQGEANEGEDGNEEYDAAENDDDDDDDDEAEYEARYLAELAHEQRENVRLRAMVCHHLTLGLQYRTHVAGEFLDHTYP